MGQPNGSSDKSKKSHPIDMVILSIVLIFVFLTGYQELASAPFWDDLTAAME